jgi:hypothetical protein
MLSETFTTNREKSQITILHLRPGVIYSQSLKHPLTRPLRVSYSRLAKIARVLVRLNHVASAIVNADNGIMRAAVELRVIDRILRPSVPQPTERQRIGDQVNAAFVFTRADFLNEL